MRRRKITARAGTACSMWAVTGSIGCGTKSIRYPDGVTRTSAKSNDWDGAAYQKLSEPQFRWGLAVLERLRLRGDETVLDVGCGSGRLTAELLERLPRGRVIAADASPSMLTQARAQLARFGERVQFIESDALQLELEQVADAVFSTATFHWILDHDR